MNKKKYLGQWRRKENGNLITVMDAREILDSHQESVEYIDVFVRYASGNTGWMMAEVLEKVYEKVPKRTK